jgi:hypothetical protein
MPKATLHLSVDSNLIEAAKTLTYPDGKSFNLSSEFEAFIRLRVSQISGVPISNSNDNDSEIARIKAIEELSKPKEITPDVKEEIDKFINDLKDEDGMIKCNWKMFAIGRSKLILNRTGKKIEPEQLIDEVEKRLANV